MQKVLRQAKAAFSLLNPGEILLQAETPLHIGLVSDGSNAYAEMEEFLAPSTLPRQEWRRRMAQIHRANDPDVPSEVDLVLYEPGLPCPAGAFSFHRGRGEDICHEILAEKGHIDLALARQFPAFRRLVVERTVQLVARENALFVLATALPNVIPTLVELPWAFGEFASDAAFLTANQIRMAFQIAAACGANVGLRDQRAAIVSIAAGAFGWRALARELVSHIPMGGGLIPKGAIAYAGTYLVGKGLEYFYVHDAAPGAEDRDQFYRQGLEFGRSFARTVHLERRG
jgi:hypothetical protein